jgi:hypothetical protein
MANIHIQHLVPTKSSVGDAGHMLGGMLGSTLTLTPPPPQQSGDVDTTQAKPRCVSRLLDVVCCHMYTTRDHAHLIIRSGNRWGALGSLGWNLIEA